MKTTLSALAVFVVFVSALVIDLDLRNWRKDERVIEHDIHIYYGYLPAKFIYNDLKVEKSSYQYGDKPGYFWKIELPNGQYVFKMTMGLSYLYAPFFFAAHLFAKTFDYSADGFSEPYKFFLLLSALFYLIVGLDYLRKILLRLNFSDRHTAITLLLVGVGTNLLCYASQQAPNVHVYLFALVAMFTYYSLLWAEQRTVWADIRLMLLLAILVLIRPSNAMYGLLFLLLNLNVLKEAGSFKRIVQLGVIGMISMAIIWAPQIYYWHLATGEYFVYSYGDEHFFFTKPKILAGLFSFRKGWLLYTPIMAFAIAGFFMMRGAERSLRIPLLAFFAVYIYVVFCWWCWWYGGTFGQRVMIDTYAIWAIPFAAFVRTIDAQARMIKAGVAALACFFIWLNIFQTYQFEKQVLHWEAMSKELYFRQFGKMERIENYDSYLDWPNADEAKRGNR